MLLIRDIVKENHRAADVGDVQIGWYPNNPFNAELAKRYMFTATAEAGKKSSTDVLKSIRDTFFYTQENRLTVIATYGHGKTHLALALANFFGKPYDSPEVSDLLNNIKHASAPLYESFRSFKEDNAPMLVVRLQGNASDSLPKLFLNGLAQALNEAEPLIGKVVLPFWSTHAIDFLQSLDEATKKKANLFLEGHRQDVAGLIAAVQTGGGAVGYDLCRALSQHLYKIPMDFGGEVSLDEAVKWVTDNHCGREKRLRGLLVLFDEFTVFVEKYAERRIGSNTGALQQLLDGIANARDAACLVAFSQIDPDQAADRFFKQEGRSHSEQDKDLTKELTRLPKDKRFLLHSSLERVLDTYLNQDMDCLASVSEQTGDAFADASDLTVQLLPRRYDNGQGWGSEEVYSVLTEGCFPLHPLTTGLLCTLQLSQGTVTRSVLGAVREALQKCEDKPAIQTVQMKGRSVATPNWIYPTALVDWFGDMLTGDVTGTLFAQYQRTLQNAGADVTPAEQGVIKAVLLQITAGLSPLFQGPGGYAQLSSFLCGFSPDDCETALQDLRARHLLDKDPVKELYRFPQGGEGEQARKLEQEVDRLAKNQKIQMLSLNDDWHKNGRLKEVPADVRSGNASDYAAKEWLFTADSFTTATLRNVVAKRFHIGAKGFETGERGAVVYLLANSDADITYFEEAVPRILAEAFPASETISIPVVVGIPYSPRPKMLGRIQREKAFASLLPADLNEYGQAAVQKVRNGVIADIEAEWKALRGEMKWVVPPAFAAAVNQSAAKNDWAIKLGVCYSLSYADMPPAFKNQYASSAINLRRSVKILSEYLLSGTLKRHQDTLKTSNRMASDIIGDYLANKGQQSSWGVVDIFGDPVASPTNFRIKKAWEHLDAAFEGSNPPPLVRDALLPLLNPPFGYDWNHVTLLFCAWLGYRIKRVTFQVSGQEKPVYDYLHLLDRSDKFIQQLCDLPDVRLVQMDETNVYKHIRGVIDATKKSPLSITETKNYRTELTKFALNTTMDAEVRAEATSAADSLGVALEQTYKYEQVAGSIRQTVDRATNPSEAQIQLERIENGALPRSLRVKAENALDEAALRYHVISRIKTLIQKEALRFGTLRHLEDYREFKNGLESLCQRATDVSDNTLRAELETQLQQLEQRWQELKDEGADSTLVAELRALRPSSMPLSDLVAARVEMKTKSARGSKAQELLDQTSENIDKAIDKATEFLQKVSDDIGSVTTMGRLSELKERLLRQMERYEGVPDSWKQIEQMQTRMQGLETAFSILERVSLRDLDDPKKLGAREEELCEARRLGREAQLLSTEQVNAFGKALEALHEKNKSEIEKANEWIAKHEDKPPRDVSILDNPPAFLSANGKKRLTAVRKKLVDVIQLRTDKEATLIITRQFKSLSEGQKQRCLEQLKEMMNQVVSKEEAA